MSSVSSSSLKAPISFKETVTLYCTDQDNRLHILRYIVVGCLVATTIVCGYGSYALLFNVN